jgi:hypothetical protein
MEFGERPENHPDLNDEGGDGLLDTPKLWQARIA